MYFVFSGHTSVPSKKQEVEEAPQNGDHEAEEDGDEVVEELGDAEDEAEVCVDCK